MFALTFRVTQSNDGAPLTNATVKSRVTVARTIDYGKYQIVDTFTNAVVAGELNTPRALTLDEVETYLTDEER